MATRHMTNSESAAVGIGAGVSAMGAAASWVGSVEVALRMGASAVAIVAGLCAIYAFIANRKKKE